MWYILSLVSSLLFCISIAHATIPSAASNHADFTLGYLHCELYADVQANNSSAASTNTSRFQECAQDATDNGLAWFLPCNTYFINNTIQFYEWQNWVNGAAEGPEPKNHIVRGSRLAGCKPELKLTSGASGFTDSGNPRPMMAYRAFWALNANAPLNAQPSNPLGLPAPSGAWKDGQANFFGPIIDNIKFNVNGNAGGIGLSMLAAQNAGIYNVEVDATGGFAGIYGLPGRNATTVNTIVTGGVHCVGGGGVWGLNLDNSLGPTLVGVTCTNQTGTAIEVSDTGPVVIVGADITKNAAGAPFRIRAPTVITDAKVTLTSGGTNAIVIDNSDAYTMYARNTWSSGSVNLAKSGSDTTAKVGTGTWSWLSEYAWNNQYNHDLSTAPDTFPSYNFSDSAVKDGPFEIRSVINGTLSGNKFPFTPQPVSNVGSPPTDLVSRHIPASIPSHEDGAFTNPDNFSGCNPTIVPFGDPSGATSGLDCTAAIQSAIDDAATAGHNRVHLPRGYLAITNSINLKPNTKLMAAGGTIGRLIYRTNWTPTSEQYFITTDSSTSGTAFLGFMGLFVRTQPFANQWMSYVHWRVGKASTMMALAPGKQFNTPSLASNPLKLFRFTGGGGGKHYTLQGLFEQLDSHSDVRHIYVSGTTQPLALYGQNTEITKANSPGANNTGYADANGEITGAQNVRWYGCKREGESPTLIVHNSTNVALYGCGAMAHPWRVGPGKGPFLQVTGTSNNVLSAVQVVRNMAIDDTGGQTMLTDSSGTFIPWPNGIAYYRKGQIDDTPFGGTTTPSVDAPVFLSAITDVANTIDVCWQRSPTDTDALLPAPPTNATGFTATVDAVAKTVTGALRTAVHCYRLTFAAGTITTGDQDVEVSYAPGNITSGGPGTPAAVAFSNQQVANNLTPTPVAVLTQTNCGFRSIYGGMETSSSGYYSDQGTMENISLQTLRGAKLRVHCNVAANTADAPIQPFTFCFDKNDSGTYALLTNTCTTNQVCYADAPDLADGAPTLAQLTATESTFVPGVLLEDATTFIPILLTNNAETGMEAAIEISSAAVVNDRFKFRVCKPDGTLISAPADTGQARIVSQRFSHQGGGIQ